MIEAVASGAACEPDLVVRTLWAPDAAAEDLLTADGFIFAAPENLASMSGPMKDFFDRCYYPVLGRLNGRPYAVVVCAGSDGTGAARQMERILTGWRLRPIAEPIIACTHAQTAEAILAPKTIADSDCLACRELGTAFATGLAGGIF